MRKQLLVLLAIGAVAAAQAGVIVYDDTVTSTGYYYSCGTTPIGDDTNLINAAKPIESATVIWRNGAAATNFTIKVELYDNNGGSVGTDLGGATFNFGSIAAGGWIATMKFPTPIAVPDTSIYTTLTFSDSNAGIYIYNPPAVGTSDDVFIKYVNGAWSSRWFSGNPVANFAIRLDAAVPEPTTMAVLGLGALLLIRRRRSK